MCLRDRAKSLAAVLGAAPRKDGYLEGGGWLVSWCLGHLAGLADAATYNPGTRQGAIEALTEMRGHLQADEDELLSLIHI